MFTKYRFIKTNISRLIVVGLLSTTILFGGFNNCVKSRLGVVETETTVDSSSETPPEIQGPNPYVKYCSANKTDVSQNKLESLSADSEDPIPNKLVESLLNESVSSNTHNLIVIVNNSCFKSYGAKSVITQSIDVSLRNDQILEQAYPLTLSRTYQGSELNSVIASDPCITRLGENASLELFSLPNDARLNELKHLSTIKFSDAYDGFTNPKNGINQTVRLCVIDTGIDPTHPDLAPNILLDSNGKVFGINTITGYDRGDTMDSNFHGSHVAGLAAGVGNNEIGITGVMGNNIKIMPVKVSLDGRSVDMVGVINGIRWAADNGADVINMSLGSATNDPSIRASEYALLKEAIDYAISKNVTVVVAAGNNGKELTTGFYVFPAMWGGEISGMLTVGSMDSVTLNRSSFSNYSTSIVEIFAPGSNGNDGVLSTVPAALTPSGYGRIYQGSPIQGTSMASPVVAGAAALVIGLSRSRGYDILPDQVEKVIRQWSYKSGTLRNYGKDGAQLDLNSLIQGINQLMGITDPLSTPRQEAKGTVAISKPPEDKNVREGQSSNVSVTVTANTSIIHGYQWFKNGYPIRGANQPSLNFSNTKLSDGAQYFVEIIAGQNKIRSKPMKLTVEQKCN